MFPPPFWPDADKATAYYERYFNYLIDIALSQFGLPPDRAADIVDEILLSSLRHLPVLSDPDAWLLGAITTAANREASR
ncbi:MAG TPA: hypothetical protein VEP28_01070 [Rubrobacter sp.]|nr:hypothetical protein [Rubrobacter sp.]